MSYLLELQHRLRDTAEVIAKTERALAQKPTKSVEFYLRSLYKMKEQYEEQFKLAAGADMSDVVSYRLFDGSDRPTVSLVGKALDSFQGLFSVIFAAVSTGRALDTAKFSPKLQIESAFNYSYSYSGSTGFVFTLPNQRMLFGESVLDESMAHLFTLARARETEEVRAFARQFGFAPVRAAFKWAAALSGGHVGAELIWRKDENIKSSLVLQPSELTALKNLIDATSDEEIDENWIPGTLVGYDSHTKSFRLDPDDGTGVIRGSTATGAILPAEVTIPRHYFALVKSLTRVKYASEENESTYFLLALEETLAKDRKN